MRKPLHDIAEIDRYLLHAMPEAEKRQFEAECALRPDLRRQVTHQRQAHRMVRWFARDARREKLRDLHEVLLTEPTFRQTIEEIFR
ncbi:hypothetical protein [Chitinophaga lutea]|uniref:hypothetical protein n=1 Tax=Chitinophaga lutea TaxID=2488634 RepID=UPI000F4FE96A|nr:hypothetical protein [Chitinophaga lutea]